MFRGGSPTCCSIYCTCSPGWDLCYVQILENIAYITADEDLDDLDLHISADDLSVDDPSVDYLSVDYPSVDDQGLDLSVDGLS